MDGQTDPEMSEDNATSNRQRWLVTIGSKTGAAIELGETVGNLNALAFIPYFLPAHDHIRGAASRAAAANWLK